MKNYLLGFGSLLILCFAGCGEKNVSVSEYLKTDKVYKIVSSESYDATNELDAVKFMTLEQDAGFIHASFGNQVEDVLKKFFVDNRDVIVLELDQNVLAANGTELRKEQNHADGDFYPHLYGKMQIPANAVVAVIKVEEMADGSWTVVK